jgi:hypothetical protein
VRTVADLGPDQHMVVIRTQAAWKAQAEAALAELGEFEHLADAAAVNYRAFCLLIEAMYALGALVSQDMMDLAGMVPVDVAVGDG